MSQIFPEWTNKLAPALTIVALVGVLSAISLVWYYGSPKFTDAGYRPIQPVEFKHTIHNGELGLDCRYCHISVETSPVSVVPPTQTCMNCHKHILPKGEKLYLVRHSWEEKAHLQWIRVHNLPDYVYFNHSAHINVGVGCSSCHGLINRMIVVRQSEPLSMGWCLDCHRNPDPSLRPADQVTVIDWHPGEDQERFAAEVKQKRKINPPEDCSGCHR